MTTEDINGYDIEDEKEWLLQSLQAVCGKLRETQVYNQEMTEIVVQIADVAGKICMLTEHEPPTIRNF